jgi:PAS domain S-box-containing protein
MSPGVPRFPWIRDGIRAALLCAVYTAAGRLALRWFASIHASASPVWAPTGIALAALLLWGYRLWPGVFAGAFLVNLFTSGAVGSSLGIAAGNTLEALAGTWLIRTFAGGREAFERARNVSAFVLLAGVAAPAVSATIGVMFLTLDDPSVWGKLSAIWLTWWLGDSGGALLVAPVLLLWGSRPRLDWDRRKTAEAALLLAALLVAVALVFEVVIRHPMRNPPLAFILLPILLWAAFRFGPRETAAAALLVAVSAVWATLAGRGPFVRAERNESLLLLQVFMGVVSAMSLLLAAAVNERQKAREGLRESEERTRLILETALDGVISMNAEGVITGWNPQAEKIFGWTAQEAIGRLLSETIVPPDARARHAKGLAKYLQTGEGPLLNRRIELTALHRDGRSIPVELAIVPMKIEGVAFFSGFVRDITARKTAETLFRDHVQEIERLNTTLAEQKAELSTYHSLVTHDVSNFCTTLQGVVEMLLLDVDGSLTPRQKELLRRANRQAFELNRLAENAKVLSRLREKGMPPMGQRVSVYGVIQRAVELVRTVHFDRKFRVDMDCPEGLSVAGIPFVENIFINLIDNAVRHSPRDCEPFIRIRSGADAERVEVTIRGGTPLDNELLARLFERYVRGPHSTGTGLGLAVIREIVERSGGAVDARTAAEGEQPVFEIALRLPKG